MGGEGVAMESNGSNIQTHTGRRKNKDFTPEGQRRKNKRQRDAVQKEFL